MSTKSNPLACPCGTVARWDRRRDIERIVCPNCGASTDWKLCGLNGEHRQDLLHEWRKLVALANTCTTPQGRVLSGKEVAG